MANPKTIRRGGRNYTRQANGTYRSDDGWVLDGAILADILAGDDYAKHGDIVRADFVGGGGGSGGGGVSADIEAADNPLDIDDGL